MGILNMMNYVTYTMGDFTFWISPWLRPLV